MPNNELAVLIVAAGSSSRLGEPKQLLKWGDSTLLEHSITTATTVTNEVHVVLGANAEEISSHIQIENVFLFQDWQKGMGASISFGLNALLEKIPDLKNVMIMVCDQPFVSKELMASLFQKHMASNELITASEYDGIVGVPAIFSKEIFTNLLALNADKGARSIISKYMANCTLVPFPEGLWDIDTPEDLIRLSR